jgi:hypothetical protein
MSNRDLILRHLLFVYPHEVTNSDLVKATHIQPHQQVFVITSRLLEQGLISGRKQGKEWFFKAKPSDVTNTVKAQVAHAPIATPSIPSGIEETDIGSASFEQMARDVFSNYFATDLRVGSLPGIPKKWDLLSRDGQIVGDAKYFSLVGGKSLPPAKFSIIAEYVWLLEKTDARKKLMVFGNQIEVPQQWLHKYGSLVKTVKFYFLDNDGVISDLN